MSALSPTRRVRPRSLVEAMRTSASGLLRGSCGRRLGSSAKREWVTDRVIPTEERRMPADRRNGGCHHG